MNPESIKIDGNVYSAKKIAEFHPGGPLFIKAFSGRDATKAFLTYHRRNFPHGNPKVEKAREKSDPDYVDDEPEWKRDFLELCELVEKVVPRHKSFAPWHYFLKIGVILGLFFGIEIYMHVTAQYPWYLMGFMGLLCALIGLNIQHDANHGAISRTPWVNRVLGMTQNWIGGSAICWIHQHVVQHHIYTNDIDNDPDLDGGALLRINPAAPLMGYHIAQHVYFFFLLAFYGFSVFVNSLINVINGAHFTPMSVLLKRHRIFEVFFSLTFFVRLVVIPLYQVPTLPTLLSVLLYFVVAGYYLSLFFAISHNFKGVEIMNEKTEKTSFLYNQVATSSNVGGPFLCFLNGGLNYQIEHHLFPRMCHCHYPIVAPIVREFCEKKNIPYVHFPTVLDNINSAIEHLFHMGTKEYPVPSLKEHLNVKESLKLHTS